MKRKVEFTAAELAMLMVAMNVEEIRAKHSDSPTFKKAVTELRNKVAREYMIADGREIESSVLVGRPKLDFVNCRGE